MSTKTFTIRIDKSDHRLLTALAKSKNRPVAELAREILSEGIRDHMDPDAIDRRMNAKRDELLEAAKRLREEMADRVIEKPHCEPVPDPRSRWHDSKPETRDGYT